MGVQARRFLKNFLRDQLGGKWPILGSIEVTRRCNSTCVFCPIGNEKPEFTKGEMNTDEIKHVIDQFAEMGVIAYSLLGGEPLLRDDICEIGRYSI